MFNLRDFIMKGIRGMVGRVPEYKVIETAAGWMDKGVLTEADLEEVDALLAPTEENAQTAAEDTDAVTESENTVTKSGNTVTENSDFPENAI